MVEEELMETAVVDFVLEESNRKIGASAWSQRVEFIEPGRVVRERPVVELSVVKRQQLVGGSCFEHVHPAGTVSLASGAAEVM